MDVDLAKVAVMLGVDELLVSRDPGDLTMTVSARIGGKWLAAAIKFGTLLDSRDRIGEIGKVMFALAQDLKQMTNVADARGKNLDQLAALVGVSREVKQRQPMNRFEAVVEELKKL